jgi:hypothetical protein
MADEKKDPENRERRELGALLPLAIRVLADTGDASEAELVSTLAAALEDPDFEVRLKKLFSEEGVSDELEAEYLGMLPELRRALSKSEP